jgi:hypothetical protein
VFYLAFLCEELGRSEREIEGVGKGGGVREEGRGERCEREEEGRGWTEEDRVPGERISCLQTRGVRCPT